jgi:hypothetical protein
MSANINVLAVSFGKVKLWETLSRFGATLSERDRSTLAATAPRWSCLSANRQKRQEFGSKRRLSSQCRLIDPETLRQSSQALSAMLYRSTHRFCCGAAPAQMRSPQSTDRAGGCGAQVLLELISQFLFFLLAVGASRGKKPSTIVKSPQSVIFAHSTSC